MAPLPGLVLFLLAMALLLTVVDGGVTDAWFTEKANYSDHDCTAGIKMEAFVGIVSVIACALCCGLRPGCLGVTYNPTRFTCDLLNAYIGPEQQCTVAPGNVYYHIKDEVYGSACSSGVDCYLGNMECNDVSVCQCQPGYSHRQGFYRGECVDGNECTSYSSTFQRSPTFVESGYDFHSEINLSLQACKDLCLSSAYSDSCRSIEIKEETGLCKLVDHTLLYAASVGHHDDWATYTRDCA